MKNVHNSVGSDARMWISYAVGKQVVVDHAYVMVRFGNVSFTIDMPPELEMVTVEVWPVLDVVIQEAGG